jgi:adenylate cyclase class 2
MHSENDQHLEIEIKFYLTDPEPMRRRLFELGAASEPRVFETNRRYDNEAQALLKAGKLLRLRHDRAWRLTYKSRPVQKDPEFKMYRELELTLDDGDTMDAILNALGFQSVQVYEKWREVFHWNKTTVCIDTMPFGTFMEIEGQKDDIVSTAKTLELKWEQRILTNYLAIFDVLRKKENLSFQDVTFDNVRDCPVDVGPYIQLFYANPE